MDNTFDSVREAKRVFDMEITALARTRDALDKSFGEITGLLLRCQGKVILTGIGKPGHIAAKIASSLSSLGTPAIYLHPAEAAHGDLGMVTDQDVVVLASYSGESREITGLLPGLEAIGCETVAITGDGDSTLARGCRYQFVFPPFEEACHLHLAPTASTAALLALGDALAVAVSGARNYTEEDFRRNHPAGMLGLRFRGAADSSEQM